MTKHLLIAAALMVVSLITIGTGLSTALASTPASTESGGKPSLGANVLSAEKALHPVQSGLTPETGVNPFSLKRGELRKTRLPPPPAPPLMLPEPPPMPMPER